MDSLFKLLARIASQLRGLGLSHRLVILLGGVLAAVSVIWLVYWAASPEMVPLLDQDFEAEELAHVRSGLELMNEPFKLVGQQVMVRPASRQVIIAQLQQQEKMPSDTSAGFNALVKESNPWISQAEHERRWTVALKHEIEQVLRRFDGVKSASVFLPLNAQRRKFARHEPAASASVTLHMAGGQPVSRDLAIAAARLVSGAVRALPLQNVEVLDGNGVSALDWESESAAIGALDRKRRKEEQRIRAKIISQLADPKVRVGVQVDLELTNSSLESETPTKPVEISSDTTNEETTRARPSAEPGVRPNVGQSTGGRMADEHTTKDTTKSQYQPGRKRELKATPPGGVTEIWAAINISRSYLEGVFYKTNPDSANPDETRSVSEEQIQAVFEREKLRVISQVTKLVKPQDEEHVAVDWYYDAALDLEPTVRASTLDETFQLARRYGPQSGLALLALLSLGLMLRMARKSDGSEAFGLEIGLPKEAIEAAQQAARDAVDVAKEASAARRAGVPTGGGRGGGILEAGEPAIGQAATTEGVLVAQEVDERTVQTHKMLEQVAEVVNKDPDNASSLLEQWVQRSDSYEK